MLGFSPKRETYFLYDGIFFRQCNVFEYCILREEAMRERRGSYDECVVSCVHSFVG
jgi:hypothetical protein